MTEGHHDYPPVVILGAGITALGVLRIAARNRLPTFVAETADPLLRASRWYRALPGDIGAPDEATFDEWLSRLPFERAVLIPCSDSWVSKVAGLGSATRQRFSSSVSASGTLQRFVDKGKFAELLRQTGTPHPFSTAVDTPADLATVPERVFPHAILKPRDSQQFMRRYGVKALHVRSREEAARSLAPLVDEGLAMILQEFVPGPPTSHFFVDGFVDASGELRGLLVRQRLRMYPADFGNSTFMVSVPPGVAADAVDAMKTLLSHVKYRGIFSAEFKRDPRDGAFKVLEVNARPWWFVDFTARCGVDVCRMAYDDALGRPVRTTDRYQIGRRSVYLYHDFAIARDLVRRRELSIWEWIRSVAWADKTIFLASDPLPFLLFATKTASASLVRKLRG